MTVITRHPQYEAAMDDWNDIQIALAGEREVKAMGAKLLPVPIGIAAAMRDNNGGRQMYEDYKFRATYPSWVRDARRSMGGLLSKVEIQPEMPSQLQYIYDSATADGQTLDVLYMRVAMALVTFGRAPLVVDVDHNGKLYIAQYGALRATNWRSSVENGRKVLTLAVFEELVADQQDDFGHEERAQYRVFRLRDGVATVEVLNPDDSVVQEEQPLLFNGKTIDFLPIIFAGSSDNDPEPDEVPLLSIAQFALKEYNLSADYYHQSHNAAHSQRYVVGLDPESDPPPFTGPNSVWLLPEGCVVGSIDADVKGLEINTVERTRIRSMSLESGAKVMDTGGAESGDARRARQDDQHASLSVIARMAAEAIEQCLGWIAQLHYWGSSQRESVLNMVSFKTVAEFRTFETDPAILKELALQVTAGVVSHSTYWEYYLTGKKPDRTIEDERELVLEGK